MVDFEPPALPVNVVYSHTKLMSTRVRLFVDWITHELHNDLKSRLTRIRRGRFNIQAKGYGTVLIPCKGVGCAFYS